MQLEVFAMTPHLKLIAKHYLGRRLRSVNDDDLAEFASFIMDVVDQRTQRCNAQAARNQQHIMAAHLVNRKTAPVRPANANNVAALHLMQLFGELSRATHAQLNEAALCGRAGNGDGRFAHTENGKLHELTGIVAECFANLIVYQAKLEQFFRFRKLRDRRDTRRPRTIRICHHQLFARQRLS